MRIFFPVQVFYPSQTGGTANTVYWQSKGLKKVGFDTIVLSTDQGVGAEVPRNRWLETEAGKVNYVKTRFVYFPFSQIIKSLTLFSRAEILHLSSIFFPTSFITALAARLFNKRVIWSVHGELDPSALIYSRKKKRLVLWGVKKIIRPDTVFHSTCTQETNYTKNIFKGNDVVQIPYYMDIPPIIDLPKEKYLLFIGRVNPKKGIENLLKALTLSERFLQSEYILKIAGKGAPEYENELKSLASALDLQNKVKFIGQIEGEEKQRLYAGAYFTIMPSHTENFGLVVVESLLQNTPVIASKGAPWQVLEDEKIGYWIDNSPEEIAKKIDHILEMDRTTYEEYQQRGRAFVIREFDINTNVEKWISVYQDLLS